MTDPAFVAAAKVLGLAAVPIRVMNSLRFWMLSHAGCELGSYVPVALSARVGPKVVRVRNGRHALALYAGLVRERGGRGL